LKKNEKQNKAIAVPKSNIQIAARGNIDTPNTQIHDRPLSRLDRGTPIKSGEVKYI